MHSRTGVSHRMQNSACLNAIVKLCCMFGETVSMLTVTGAIKEPRVMRHMNAALFTAAVERRIARHGICRALFVAVRDGGV